MRYVYVAHVGHIFHLCYFAFLKISKKLKNTKKYPEQVCVKKNIYCIVYL